MKNAILFLVFSVILYIAWNSGALNEWVLINMTSEQEDAANELLKWLLWTSMGYIFFVAFYNL